MIVENNHNRSQSRDYSWEEKFVNNETPVVTQSIVDIIKGLEPMMPVAFADRKTVKDVNPEVQQAGAVRKTYTDKDRMVIGSGELKATWTPICFDWSTTEKLKKLATLAGIQAQNPVAEMYGNIIKEWVDDHLDQITEVVGEMIEEEMTNEKLEATIRNAQRAMERAQAALAARKGKG